MFVNLSRKRSANPMSSAKKLLGSEPVPSPYPARDSPRQNHMGYTQPSGLHRGSAHNQWSYAENWSRTEAGGRFHQLQTLPSTIPLGEDHRQITEVHKRQELGGGLKNYSRLTHDQMSRATGQFH